jgi:negative regulator of genetic competence, sporulation and motility
MSHFISRELQSSFNVKGQNVFARDLNETMATNYRMTGKYYFSILFTNLVSHAQHHSSRMAHFERSSFCKSP